MNIALGVLSLALLILAVIGWVGCVSRGRRIVELRAEKASLSAKADGLLLLKTHLRITAHGKGGEPVTIEASRQAARTDVPWNVHITGEGVKNSVRNAGEFPEIVIRPIDGNPTAILQVGRVANLKVDHVYPRVEGMQLVTR